MTYLYLALGWTALSAIGYTILLRARYSRRRR